MKKIGLRKYGAASLLSGASMVFRYMLAAKERHVRFVTWLTVSPGGRVVKAGGTLLKRLYGSDSTPAGFISASEVGTRPDSNPQPQS